MHPLPCLLLSLSVVGAAPHAAQFASPEQARRLAARERLLDDGDVARRAGQDGRAATIARAVFAVDREVFGHIQYGHLGAADWLADKYEDAGEWRQADAVRLEALRACEKVLGPTHWRTATARLLREQGRRLAKLSPRHRAALAQAWRRMDEGDAEMKEGRHDLAGPLYKKALEIRLDVLGARDMETTGSQQALAEVYRGQGRLRQALPLAQQAAGTRRTALGDAHPLTWQAENLVGLIQQELGDYRAALPALRRSLVSAWAVYGPRSPQRATALNNLALVHEGLVDFREAARLLEMSRAVCVEAGLTGDSDYALLLGNLARSRAQLGQGREALALFEESLALRRKTLGESSIDYAGGLLQLAEFHRESGRLGPAMEGYTRALGIVEDAVGRRHRLAAEALNGQALCHHDRGEPHKALPLYRECIAILRDIRPEELTPDDAVLLQNVANLYRELADYASALALYKEADRLLRSRLGPDHPHVALVLRNVAEVYRRQGKFDLALPSLEKALALRRRAFGPAHPRTAEILGDLATCLIEVGRAGDALPMAREAARLLRSHLSDDTTPVLIALSNLALAHEASGETAAASRIMRHVAVRGTALYGADGPPAAMAQANLARYEAALGHPARARAGADRALAASATYLRRSALVLPARQHLALVLDFRKFLDFRLSLPDGGADAYGHVLGWKGAVLARERSLHALARLARESDPRSRLLADRLAELARELAELSARRGPGDERRIALLAQEKDVLESRLAGSSEAFSAYRREEAPSPRVLADTLPEGVALADFLFHRAGKGVRLAAFVVRRGGPAVRLDLGDGAEIEALVGRWREGMSKDGRPDAEAGDKLRRRLWAPLEKHVAGAKMVLVSPDGALNALPFTALPGKEEGTYLIEDVALAVLPVPRLLPSLLAPAPARNGASLLLVGGVDFGKGPGGRLPALPGTEHEAGLIAGRFTKAFAGGKLHHLKGADATAAAARRLIPGSRFLHLATHGAFASSAGMHPGLQSGVALAGANRGGAATLTALELASLDLSSCELAVLSACDTGLGRVAPGEGVLGLQRSLQVAGARSAVTSLWSVHDGATSVLMEEMYARLWGEGKVSKLEALRQAQIFVLNNPGAVEKRLAAMSVSVGSGLRGAGKASEKLPKTGKRRSPAAWWAAFTLAGDWR